MVKSQYGDRDTVGTIYQKARTKGHDYIPVGDVSDEFAKSLVDDLNETIASKPFGDREFYITVHESKDMMMPKAIRRRMLVGKRRPYPEDDTVVFRVDPKKGDVFFCWCLPHHTSMPNMLINAHWYDPEMITHIKAWKKCDLEPFGFAWVNGKPVVNKNHKDKCISSYKKQSEGELVRSVVLSGSSSCDKTEGKLSENLSPQLTGVK